MRYVIAANVNALIEKAEDPEKLLRALIREMEDAGEEARAASAEVLAELSHLQRAVKEQATQQQQWRERAEKAVLEDRDDLAREALKTAADIANRQSALAQEEELLKSRSEQLNTDMATLKHKLAEAKLKLRDMLQKPSMHPAVAARNLPQSRAEKRIQRAMSRFDGLQAQVENLEARVASYETGGASPAVWSAASQATDPEVEEALAQLKTRLADRNSPNAAAAKVAREPAKSQQESTEASA
ncbi:MAG TPA: PspA/IM30 family protein, partial [Xanthomonadales bacterium]|nr:PspA/IM30 family protein [Xanthomonadales bacterium]